MNDKIKELLKKKSIDVFSYNSDSVEIYVTKINPELLTSINIEEDSCSYEQEDPDTEMLIHIEAYFTFNSAHKALVQYLKDRLNKALRVEGTAKNKKISYVTGYEIF